MEQALYHPSAGYYSSGRARIGRTGDYFTNVSVGSLFGRILAAQFEEMWRALDRPNEFSLVEQGAHDGQLAQDVCHAAQRHYPEFFQALRYQIVEPFPILRARQIETLRALLEKFSWRASLETLPEFRGVHFSNELIDALPVHLVKWTGAEWRERHVGLSGEALEFIDLPLSSTELEQQVSNIPLPLPARYETEINLNAASWIRSVSAKLIQGFVLAIDYGFPRAEFYAPHRTRGTLQCYAKHRASDPSLQEVGQADITAHVEWTSLIEAAEKSGLTSDGFCDQHHFLAGLLTGELGREFESDPNPKTIRALQTLLQPSLLGMKFQFLVLTRNADGAGLSGLRFAKR